MWRYIFNILEKKNRWKKCTYCTNEQIIINESTVYVSIDIRDEVNTFDILLIPFEAKYRLFEATRYSIIRAFQ